MVAPEFEGSGGAGSYMGNMPGTYKPAPTTTYTGAQEHRNGTTAPRAKAAAKPPPPTSATAGAAAGGTTGRSYKHDVVSGPLINPKHHHLSESDFLLGRENARRNPHRGTIVRTAEFAGASDAKFRPKKRYAFRFLYNPETITFNTNVYAGVAPPEFLDQNDPTAGGAKFIGQETVSFGLMLDRTQEVYEAKLNDPENRGTLLDLEALYRVANGSVGMKAGFLYLSEVEIHWGPRNALPMFRGYITSINVTHTKFTPNMTPMRSLVDISVARLSDPDAGGNAHALYEGGSAATALPAPSGLLATSGGG